MTTPKPADNVVQLSPGSRDETLKGVTNFVKDHPGLVVAGGLAVGLLAGALFAPRAGGRIARGAKALAEAADNAGEAAQRLLRKAVDLAGKLRA